MACTISPVLLIPLVSPNFQCAEKNNKLLTNITLTYSLKEAMFKYFKRLNIYLFIGPQDLIYDP